MPKLRTLSGTPKSQGFTFPAEWTRHAGTWFSWPRPEGISFPAKYHTVPANIAAFVREIAPREVVNINVPNENYERIVREQLIHGGVSRRYFAPQTPLEGVPSRKSRIRFHYLKTNESWCRDHGPAFVVKRGSTGRYTQFAIVHWGFNAWGGKYPPYDADNTVPTHIAQEFAHDRTPGFAGVFYPKHKGVPVIMEGGSVEFNNLGTVMTTEACLLNKNRNPNLTKKEIERYLKEYYGQHHVLWLGDGIAGDDTDGHIDDLARFISPRTIATVVEQDPRDENYKVLRDNLRRLQLARDQDGRTFNIIQLPMPRAVIREDQRLPASYANFYFINGAVLLPTYRDRRNDRLAADLLQQALPRHQVIGIDSTELIWGLGSIHCLTQQQPAI
jgi:agmatine deiminase